MMISVEVVVVIEEKDEKLAGRFFITKTSRLSSSQERVEKNFIIHIIYLV